MALTKLNSASVIDRLPTGSVIQTVQNTTSSEMTATDSYSDTGLSVQITPTSSSNKILVMFSQSIFFQTNGCSVRLLRDSTAIIIPTTNYQYHDTGSSSTAMRTVLTHHFLITQQPQVQQLIKHKSFVMVLLLLRLILRVNLHILQLWRSKSNGQSI